jgi:hypothetical protein
MNRDRVLSFVVIAEHTRSLVSRVFAQNAACQRILAEQYFADHPHVQEVAHHCRTGVSRRSRAQDEHEIAHKLLSERPAFGDIGHFL